MSALFGSARRAASRVASAGTALRLFFQGFTGVPTASRDFPHAMHDAPADPRSVREALCAEAARRGRCC